MRQASLVLALLLLAACDDVEPPAPPAAAPAARASRVTRPPEPPPARFARLDGMKVHYEVIGRGEPALVLVHGLGGDSTLWRRQVEDLAPRARLVVLDLPGHGRSDAPRIDYTEDLFARAIEAVLADAGIERAVLVGHALSVPAVRQFYRRFPGKTIALVAIDGPFRPPSADPTVVEQYLGPLRGSDFAHALSQIADLMTAPVESEPLRREIAGVMMRTPQHVAVSAAEGLLDPGIWREDPIRVPLLVVLADSPLWTPADETYVRRLAPRAEVHVLEGASPFLMLERPRQLDGLVIEFLRRIGARPA